MSHSPTRTNTNSQWRQQTRLVHAGQNRSAHGETSEALYLTSGYVYDSAEAAELRFKGEEDGYVYSRYANPTLTMLEERLVALEGAEACRTTSSGMAAVAASIIAPLKSGDHVVAADALFGSTLYILENICKGFGVEVTFVRAPDTEAWGRAMRPNTKLVFFETPTNPTLEIVDIEAVAAFARDVGAQVIVDNVFSTPLLQRPLKHGADIVVYSTTKHIDGQGRCLGGAILGPSDYIAGPLHDYLKHTGPALSPFNAWVAVKGLETLALRVRAHVANARALARVLGQSSKVSWVSYPGLPDHPQFKTGQRQMDDGGPLVAFEVKGGKLAAFRFLNALKLVLISNNLGDAKSLITHPATTTHQRLDPELRATLGITDGALRLSAGIEDLEDLKADLAQALEAI